MASAYTDDGDLRYDGLFDVLLKSHYGSAAKHPPARDACDAYDGRFSPKGTHTALSLRDSTVSKIRLLRSAKHLSRSSSQ